MKGMHATLALAAVAAPLIAQESSFSFDAPSTARTAPSLLAWQTQEDSGAAPALPNEQNSQLESVTVYWENDGGFLKPYDSNDRHYTNGLGIEFGWTSTQYDKWSRFIPFIGQMEDPEFAFGLQFRQFMFTPDDLDATELVADDRPYAGWLTGGFFVQRSDEHNFDHAQLDIGVVGGSMTGAENVQKFVHRILPNQVNPEGWDNQLSNELAINVLYQHRWRTSTANLGGLELDAIPLAGFEFGNVAINAHAGVIGRVGINLPRDFGPGNLREFRDHTGSRPDKWELYGYGRLDAEAVAHDIFLDGNTFADSHSVEKKPLVGSGTLGIVFRYDWFRIGYSATYETERFDGQSGGDSYGSLSLTGTWNF